MRILLFSLLLAIFNMPAHALHNIILKNGESITGRLLLENSKYLVMQSAGRFLLLYAGDVARNENPDPAYDKPEPYINGIRADIMFDNNIDIEAEILTETGGLLVVRTAELTESEFDKKIYVLQKSSIRKIAYRLPYGNADQMMILTQAYDAVMVEGQQRLAPRYGSTPTLPMTFTAGNSDAVDGVNFTGLAFRLPPGARASVVRNPDGSYAVDLLDGRIYIDGSRSQASVTVRSRKGTCAGEAARFMVDDDGAAVTMQVHTGPVRVQAASSIPVEVEMDDPRYKAVLTGPDGSVLLEQHTVTTPELSDLAGNLSLLGMRTFMYQDTPPREAGDALFSSRGRWWLGIGAFAALAVTYSTIYLIGNR